MAGQYRFKDSNGNIVAQISASVDGVISFSGSQVDFSQANNISLGEVQLAGTASNALLLDGFDSQAFAFTSSIHPFTASIAGTNTFTSSATARLNALESTSASVDTLNTNQNNRLESLETISASNISRLNSIEIISASNLERLNSLEIKTGSLATTGSNTFIGTQTITGSLFISADLVVQGSSSLQNITASAVSIGTNIVNLNTANPAIRYAGLSIGDSGSIGGSGSFLYDSVQDEMIFIHRGANTTVTSSVVLMGPQTYDNVGTEIYPTNNRIQKGTGNEHLADSCITDSGTLVTINSATQINSSITGCGAISTSGTGLNASLRINNTTSSTGKDWHSYSLNNGNFGLYNNTDSCYAYQITPSGNLGIGTNTPGTKLEILSRAADADRTIPHNILTLTAEQGNAPYGFFGGAILFKNRSYTSGLVESSRIRSVIYDDGAPNNCGGGLWFETTPTPGGTLTPSLVIDYQGKVGIGTTSTAEPLTVSFQAHGLISQHRQSCGVGVGQNFYMKFNNVVGSPVSYAGIYSDIQSNTNGGHSGRMILQVANNGSLSSAVTIANTGVTTFASTICSPQFTGGFVCAVGGLNVRGASTTWSTFNIIPDNPGGAGAQCNTVLAATITGCSGWGPQLRFSGANGFIDIGQNCTGGFVIETSDTPRFNVSQNGLVSAESLSITTPSLHGIKTFNSGATSSYVINLPAEFPNALLTGGNVWGVIGKALFFNGGTAEVRDFYIARNSGGSWSSANYGPQVVTSGGILQSVTGTGTCIIINMNASSYVTVELTAMVR